MLQISEAEKLVMKQLHDKEVRGAHGQLELDLDEESTEWNRLVKLGTNDN